MHGHLLRSQFLVQKALLTFYSRSKLTAQPILPQSAKSLPKNIANDSTILIMQRAQAMWMTSSSRANRARRSSLHYRHCVISTRPHLLASMGISRYEQPVNLSANYCPRHGTCLRCDHLVMVDDGIAYENRQRKRVRLR